MNLTCFSPNPNQILQRLISKKMIPDKYKSQVFKKRLLGSISSSITKVKGNLVQYMKDSLKEMDKKKVPGEVYIDTIIRKLYKFLEQKSPELICPSDKYSVGQCILEIRSNSKNFISRVEKLNIEFVGRSSGDRKYLLEELLAKAEILYPLIF